MAGLIEVLSDGIRALFGGSHGEAVKARIVTVEPAVIEDIDDGYSALISQDRSDRWVRVAGKTDKWALTMLEGLRDLFASVIVRVRSKSRDHAEKARGTDIAWADTSDKTMISAVSLASAKAGPTATRPRKAGLRHCSAKRRQPFWSPEVGLLSAA